MFKNTATKIKLFAFTPADGLPVTGDAGNITMYVSKDSGTVTALTDTSASELNNTTAKGWYVCDVSQTEANADDLLFTGTSVTSGVVLVSAQVYTTPPLFTAFVTPTGAAVNATQIGSQTASAAGTVTFPGTVASATNITAGTITTVTNLTNAPTSGDLTNTMKTSVATAALTTAMTESYAADGATATLAQAVYLMMQRLGQFSIASTTITVKKLDGSTTAATYDIGDATNPTFSDRTA